MSDISKRFADLSPEKQALLLKRLKSKKTVNNVIKIPRRDRTQNRFPLSYSQRRQWFLNQLEPQSGAYNIWDTIGLKGEIKFSVLEDSFFELQSRHEVLRTIYPIADGEPVQEILPSGQPFLPIADLQGLEPARRSKELERLLVTEMSRPFNLISGPIFRATLIRSTAEEHILLFVMDHIAADGWSHTILIGDLGAIYEAYSKGQKSPLEELEIQYADFAVWQREWLEGEAYESLLGYWKNQLEGAPRLIELPTDKPRPALQTYRGAYYSIIFPAELNEAIKAFNSREEVTLYMTLLAGFALLMRRYSGQQTICVGTPIAQRNRAEIERLVGCFINTLVMRVDIDDDLTFRQLVKHVQEVTLGAYAHQDMPFERLVEELELDRSLSHTPLFQVMFGLQNLPGFKPDRFGESFMPGKTQIMTAKFDVEFAAIESRNGELACGVQYNTDLFDESRMIRMGDHFINLLKFGIKNPDKRLARISMLDEKEIAQVVTQWNATEYFYPKEKRAHELISDQARKTPERVAVECANRRLSYEELERRSDQAARALIKEGVGLEEVIGLLADRSADFLTLMLGVFKAGAAYLPLDTNHPPKRIRQVIEQSRALYILASTAYIGKMTEALQEQAGLPPVKIIEIERLLNENPPQEIRLPRAEANNLCYVIYTSGSTGLPKGAMVEHNGMLNHLLAKVEDLQLRDGDAVGQTASQCFDISVWQFLAPLLVGGRVRIIEDDDAHDPARLAKRVETDKLTVLETVPTLLRAMMQEVKLSESLREGMLGLRWMVATGEALSPDLAREWVETFQDIKLMNAYGPTECSDDVTHYTVESAPPKETLYMPIGRPIINTQIYILDKDLRPSPVGVEGEVHVGGEGVGRGYLNDPLRTAEVFIPNLFGKQPGARLYKTGDIATYREDGNIQYIGRRDNQVKLRGYRIELGDIESVLMEHPAIRDITVTIRGKHPQEKALVAYYIAEQNSNADEREFRIYAREKLPAYMVPAVFVRLEAMPVTSTGKLDRAALPEPDGLEIGSSSHYAPPRTPTEEMLAGIWAEVLRLERVGIYDNFFDLGGHSLLATQVMSRVRKAFQCEIRLSVLFETPTIAELSEAIEMELRIGRGMQFQPIKRAQRNAALPLSYSQQRQFFLEQMEPGTAAYNMPMAERFRGRLDIDVLRRTVTEATRRHEILRTVFMEVDGAPAQVINEPTEAHLPLIDLSQLEAKAREVEAARLASDEAWRPFNLSEGPLMRVSLLRIGEDDNILLLTMHHIITDGWSMGVLITELMTLYEAFADGRPSPLPELTIQYADYAVWQQNWVQGEILEKQLAFWKQHLSGVPVLELQTDRPRPPVQSYRGDHEPILLGPELSEQVQSLSRSEGATLFMTLLTAWQVLLMRYSGQSDISVGSFIANRNRAETEGLIGFLVNNLVFRTDLSGNPTFRESLERVRQVALDAYVHQDVPFELLLEKLRPERDTSRTNLFQVMFVLQNNPAPGASASDDSETSNDQVKPVSVRGSGRSNFDLTLWMTEGPQGLMGRLDYATDLFNAGTIRRMAAHFITLLKGAMANPDQHLDQLPMLSESERNQLLVEWNNNRLEYPRDVCIHELFEAQASRQPGEVAIVFGETRVTYGELNQRANQLARLLRSNGVGPETRVGIYMERSQEMVLAVLAVMKAGGAFVPLDPSHPIKRLLFMLEDSGASMLLTQLQLIQNLPAIDADQIGERIKQIRMIFLDSPSESMQSQSAENLGTTATPDNLAYLIYTSGTTSRPRGALIEHKSLVNALWGWERAYSLSTTTSCHLQTASFAFDVFTGDVVRTLGLGKRMVICPAEFLLSAPELYDLMRREEVDSCEMVPVVLRNLAQYLEESEQSLDFMRLIVTGADTIFTKEMDQIRKLCGPQTRLINSYGLTEVTIDSTYFEGTEIELTRGKPAPIGRPFANTEAYVLDRQMQPIPVGIAGELSVGGPGLARGYINDPALTAIKFVPNPFSNEPGARLYRTGDQTRYLADGNIEFLGRMDFQLKIRGFRIEPEEIEAALSKHKGVQEVLVMGREDKPGDAKLVAYVVPVKSETPPLQELRQLVKEQLPAYMVPSAFIMMDAFPTTPNGKVDRRALPPPATDNQAIEDSYVAPTNTIEEILAEIWGEVMGRKQIGIFDNFFELGGHSLLAVQVISRARKAFEIEIPLRSIFESPTIAELALAIEDALLKEVEAEEAEFAEDVEAGDGQSPATDLTAQEGTPAGPA